MAAEIIGRFKNQISTPALKAVADLEKLTGAAAGAQAALKGLEGAGGSAAPARGRGGRSAAPANTNGSAASSAGSGASAAPRITSEAKAEAAAVRKKAAERAAAEKYVAGIRDRYFAAEQKRRDKEDADKEKAAKRAAGGGPGARLRAAGAAGGAAAGEAAANKLLGAAKLAAAGLGAASLGQLALGYRGMERLAGITARAQMRFRQLFSGVQPKPLLDVIERTSLLFSKSTVAGRALGGLFERAFNGLFGTVKGAEPFILDFFKGIVLGGLKFENVFLRLRIAVFPLTSALGKMINEVGVGSAIGQVAVGLLAFKLGAAAVNAVRLGAAALGAAGPFVALAAAAGAAYVAIKQAFDEKDRANTKAVTDEAERGNLLGKARAEKRATGKVSAATQAALRAQEAALASETAKPLEKAGVVGKVLGTAAGTDKIALQQREAMIDDLAATRQLMADGGAAAGSAMGAGIVAGMKASEAAARAGGAGLAKAADTGVKDEAQIHSPARKFILSGRRMGEGVVVGVQQMEAPVQAAASKSLVPRLDGAAAGGGRGSGGGGAKELHFHFANYVGGRDELMAMIRDGVALLMTETNAGMGLDTGEAA